MTPKEKSLYGVFTEVRACFHQLRNLTDALHADLGVTTCMRGVMESLAARGGQTVPEIARSKAVSRQHIQILMNALAAAELVAASDNPAHARSLVFDLTPKGRKMFAAMRAREAAPLSRMAASLSLAGLDQARLALADLNRLLTEEFSNTHAERKHVAA